MGLLTKEDASDMGRSDSTFNVGDPWSLTPGTFSAGDLYMLHRHLTSIDLFTSAARLKDEHLEDLNGRKSARSAFWGACPEPVRSPGHGRRESSAGSCSRRAANHFGPDPT